MDLPKTREIGNENGADTRIKGGIQMDLCVRSMSLA